MENNKKRLIGNFLLLVWVIALIAVAVILVVRFNKSHPEEENVDSGELKNVGFNNLVDHMGYPDPKNICRDFIKAFNTSDGELLASLMELPSEYIYDYIKYEVEQEGTAQDVDQETVKRFDDKYEEVMKNPREFKDFVLMQYEMEKKEKEIIDGMPKEAATLTLLNEPEVEEVTKYLSKMIIKVNVKNSTVDEDDTIELRLLHRNEAYFLMNYLLIDSVEK